MSDLAFREHAEGSVQRIAQSLFAFDHETSAAQAALADISKAQSATAVQEQIEAIDEILSLVMSRESGRTQLKRDDRRNIEEGLASLEDRLIMEIEQRKRGQRRDLLALGGLLMFSVVAVLAGGVFLVVRPAEGPPGTVGGGLALAAGLSCCLIVSRLIQNTRESLERLDEKIVAVRFLRMALHPSWTTEVGGALMAPALVMFAQHFAPSSAPLGHEDTKAVLDAFKLR